MPIATLSPRIVWQHFATLCTIPRPSKHEAAVRQCLAEWAASRGLAHETDQAGNLLIRRPASPGHEGAPTLALQAHLDMVCQAKSGVAHDFLQVGIAARIDGDWLRADNTTLGADNGIGVALMLAALEDETLLHGPLEALFTVDEEAGMGGAHGLQAGWLQAKQMLNLDTEEWGEFYLGCAGGCDVNIAAALPVVPLQPGNALFCLDLGGLRGGHSGCDIHLKRGNANRLLAEALAVLRDALGDALQLIELHGGTARNALPREARALIALPTKMAASATQRLGNLVANWRKQLIADDGEQAIVLALTLERDSAANASVTAAIETAAANALIDTLNATPYGVHAMSRDFAGVVETSNNLGIVKLAGGKFTANLMVRSLRDDAAIALAATIADSFRAAECGVTIDGHYPGWTPNPASPLLALCQQVYRQTFAAESTVQVIHAGLECGIIGAKYPSLDTVSFGPTIRGAHAPGERVDIASVGRCWTLLRAVIEALASSDAEANDRG